MKNKIVFKLDWLEMTTILIMIFFAGIFVSGNMEDKFIYTGLLIITVGIIIIKKKIKTPIK